VDSIIPAVFLFILSSLVKSISRGNLLKRVPYLTLPCQNL
jgi:hypothetical protein